jgi:parallel beta-helix repeat protein
MDGSDLNNGRGNSPSKAWATLSHAIANMNGGDHLLVADGEYIAETILIDSLHATAERPTLIKSMNPWGAVISRIEEAHPDSSVIVIANSSFLQVEGFEIVDNKTGLESGVDVRDHSHHITIKGCYIHDCACGGISSRKSDYLTFEENVIRDNAKRNKWNCSGISVWHPIEVDQEPGFHIIIRKNISFENECDIPFTPLGHTTPTDGNGIIVDDYRATQKIENALGQEGGFKSGTLIENNLCFNNGGKGINVFKSDNVTIRNNTSYHNLRVLHKYGDFSGDITIGNSNGLRFYNNIIVQNPDYPTSALRCYDNDSTNTKIFNNIFVGDVRVSGQNLFLQDNQIRPKDETHYPGFVNPTVDVEFSSITDFRDYFDLREDSPAWQTGIVSEADFSIGANIGCYENDIDD